MKSVWNKAMGRKTFGLLKICVLVGLLLFSQRSAAGVVSRNLIAVETARVIQEQQGNQDRAGRAIVWAQRAGEVKFLDRSGRRLLAQVYLSAQDPRSAADILNVDGADCGDAMTCYWSGEAHYALGHIEDALAVWRDTPGSDLYFAFRGDIAYEQGDIAEASRLYDISWRIKSAPGRGKVTMLQNLCSMNRDARDMTSAVYWCQQAVASRGSYWTVLELGRTYYEAQQYDLAERTLREAIRIAPSRGGAYHWLGLALSRLGRPQESVEALYDSVRLEPNNPWTRVDLADRLVLQGEYGKAVCEYMKARDLTNRSELLRKIEEKLTALPLDAGSIHGCGD